MDQQTLDRFTRMDELMERMAITLEQIAGKETEICVPPVEGLGGLVDVLNRQAAERENVWQLSYPKDGTRATLGVGTTDLDFEAGTITDYAGTVTQMSSSLRKQGKDWMQSCAMKANQDIIIRFDQHDKIPISAYEWYRVNHQEFKRVRITTTVSTEFLVTVSTAPALIDVARDVIEQMDVAIRTASGDLTAGESTTAIIDLGMFSLAVLQLDVTKITTPDGDDEVDFYIQTSYDAGSNWIDLENIHFAQADNGTTSTRLIVLGLPQSSAVARAVTDGSLADDTKLDLPFADRIRIKTTVTGATAPTYAYDCYAAFKV